MSLSSCHFANNNRSRQTPDANKVGIVVEMAKLEFFGARDVDDRDVV